MAHARRADGGYRAAIDRLPPYEGIARLIIGVRMELGTSQEELASRVGTSSSAIARLESGKHRPSVETLRRVAHALDRELIIEFRPMRRDDLDTEAREEHSTTGGDSPRRGALMGRPRP